MAGEGAGQGVALQDGWWRVLTGCCSRGSVVGRVPTGCALQDQLVKGPDSACSTGTAGEGSGQGVALQDDW